jgi:hypothetical protein
MTPYSANPFVYIFSAIAIGGMFLYFIYAGIDRVGIEVHTASATVTGKQFTKSGKSYYTTIAGDQAWVQSQRTPETYVVLLNVEGERTVAVVSKQQYDSLQADDIVQVRTRRTRITQRLEVVEVTQ